MAKLGDFVQIIDMVNEPSYNGKCGFVKYIDDLGQLHGTWGGCAIIPNLDKFIVVNPNEKI